jgi:alpha-1,2-mannosyltransferase
VTAIEPSSTPAKLETKRSNPISWVKKAVDILLVVSCLLICVGSSLQLTRLAIASACGHDLYDFSQEWTSARNFVVGQPVYLDYGRSVEIHFGRRISAHFQYNAHPPASILLALPFSPLAYRHAFLAWTALSAFCLAVSLWFLVRGCRPRPSALQALVPVTFVLTSSALVQQTIQGQLNLVLLALITGAWFAHRKDRLGLSGFLIGVAAAIKLFPAFLVLVPLAQRKWRAVSGTAVAFLSVNGLGWGLLGGQTYLDYFLIVTPDVAKFRDTWPNASLLGFWSKLFDGGFGQVLPVFHAPILAKSLAGVSCLALAAATYWAVARIGRRTAGAAVADSDLDLAFSLGCAGMLLASPITWDHYFLLLLPGLWLVWRACSGQVIFQALVVTFAIALVWANPFTLWRAAIPEHFGRNGQVYPVGPVGVLTLLSFQFYSLLGFYLLVFAELGRRRRILNAARQ